MLSGFFGLIAMETSPGLIAEGSVIRTTCWAIVSCTPTLMLSRIKRDLIFVSLRRFVNHVNVLTQRTDRDSKPYRQLRRENYGEGISGIKNDNRSRRDSSLGRGTRRSSGQGQRHGE